MTTMTPKWFRWWRENVREERQRHRLPPPAQVFAFKAGDVVSHVRAPTLRMTVEWAVPRAQIHWAEPGIHCVWFDGDNHLCRAVFTREADLFLREGA